MGQLQQMLHENYEHSILQRDEFDNLIKEIIHYLENQKKYIEQKRAEKQQELRKMHTNFQMTHGFHNTLLPKHFFYQFCLSYSFSDFLQMDIRRTWHHEQPGFVCRNETCPFVF